MSRSPSRFIYLALTDLFVLDYSGIPEYEACTVEGGFFTNADCFFIVQQGTGTSMTWEQAMTLCQNRKASLAIVADTNEAMEAVYAFGLSKVS